MANHTNKLGMRAALLSTAVAAACLQLSTPVFAQSNGNSDLTEVVVTGSRIARNPETYSGSMSIVNESAIEAVPSYNLSDMLLKMPSVGLQGNGRNDSNGGRGTNFTEIHNLGISRTLVLMNGRRMVPTVLDSSNLAVDMQSFPINMIDRVEVLADGASSVYGSDAVGGVVNVITKTNFDGVQVSGGYGDPTEAGGNSYNYGMLAGATGDKGHFLMGFTVTQSDNVTYQQRDWAKVPVLGSLDIGLGHPTPLMGSGIPPQGVVSTPNHKIIFIPDSTTGHSYQPYDTFGTSGLNGSAGDGTLQSVIDTGHRYNYNYVPGGEQPSLIAPAHVFNGGMTGEYNLSDNVTAYMEMLGQYREGTLYFTPLPVSGAGGRFTDLLQVPFNNPNIPADALALIQPDILSEDPTATGFQESYRVMDLGQRIFNYDSTMLKATVGFKGTLSTGNTDWDWDTFVTAGHSVLSEITHNQVNVNHLQIAVDPARCALDSSCPKDDMGNPTLNIFGLSPKSQAEKDYVLFNDHDKTQYQMVHAAATVSTTDLFVAPGGNAGFAAGLEYREESGSTTPSGVVSAGNSGGNFADPTSGRYKVWEAYAETDVPLISGAPMAQDVSIQAAARYSHYDTSGSESTWKLGGRWELNDMLAFRAQASTGFRAPSILELFGGKADNYIGVTDPCNAEIQATSTTIAANCAAQGVPSNFVQPAAQLKVSQGGNPDLKAETSDNYSAGLVFTPDAWIPDLRVTLDWYSVEVKNAVDTPDPVQIINDCYNSSGLSAPECARIGRGSGHDVVRFDLLLENLDKIKTSGIDVNATYSFNTLLGTMKVDWLLNYLKKYEKTTATGTVQDLTGKVTCDVCDYAAYPKLRSYLTASMDFSQDWSASVAWRYIDGMNIDDGIGLEQYTLTTPSVSYFDANVSYNHGNGHYMLGAENLANKTPPYVPSIANNTSNIYDFLGRMFFVRASYNF